MTQLQSSWRRTLMIATLSMVTAVLGAAADLNRLTGESMFIATTGRIVSIDLKNKILKIRGSESEPVRNFAQAKPEITLPGGVNIRIPVRMDKGPSKSATKPNLDEY